MEGQTDRAWVSYDAHGLGIFTDTATDTAGATASLAPAVGDVPRRSLVSGRQTVTKYNQIYR